MSGIALIWAANVKGLQPAAKVVLIQLADFHNKETGRCDPSAKRLAHECEMSRATVFRHLTVLEEIGLITRHGKGDDNGGRSSNQYELHLDVTLGPSSKQGEKSQIETGGKSLTRETGVVSNCDTNLTIEPGKNLSPQPPKGGRRGRKENSFGVSESVKQRLREKYSSTGGGNEL
ncbi:MAG: helix-turn-helix domain-containing protein [Donghicola eburneus]|nr:helix-turn-helix domain-containing protein [Donghicola eburneus]MCI5040043.1 helix-turn-helix domain-containing protein [Donghicola eburneus]